MGSGNGQRAGSLGARFTVLILSCVLLVWVRRVGQGVRQVKGRWREAVCDTHAMGTMVGGGGGNCVMCRAPGTHPDFVILCLVLQILIKFLLRIEFNAIYFKLLANLEVRKRNKVVRCQDNGRAVCVSVCMHVQACGGGLKSAFDNPEALGSRQVLKKCEPQSHKYQSHA